MGIKRTFSQSQPSSQVTKRPRYYRRKYFRKGLKLLGIKYHNFVRAVSTQNAGSVYRIGLDTYQGFVINGVASNSWNMGFAFRLDGVNIYVNGVSSATLAMPNYSEFTNLYDQYRIDYVECDFIFSNNSSSVNSPATVLPVIHYAKDYDDTNATAQEQLQQYSTYGCWQLGNASNSNGMKRIFIKPNVDLQVYNGVTSGYARSKPIFVDTQSASVPHYGLKIALDPINVPGSATLVGYLSIVFKFHMTMAHTK